MRPRQFRQSKVSAVLLLAILPLAACASSDDGDPGGLGGRPVGGWDQPRVNLTGLHQMQLDQLLGPPQFKRIDGKARLLQYRNTACVLDVFVYEGGGSGEGRVEHVEARDHGLRQVSEAVCLASLLRERGAG